MTDEPDNTTTLILERTPATGVAQIILNRPDARNAQNLDLLYALDKAFGRAAASPDVRVIILSANGPHFSAGHDLRRSLDQEPLGRFREDENGAGIAESGGLGYMAREQALYIDLCDKWRNIAKPTIAAVHGKCIAAGLMLAWVCDLIISSDDALFLDPTVAMGAPGVEWFSHPWELGARKAKELLFTGDAWTARQALDLGMVNHVVNPDNLAAFTLELAEKIARQPAFALKAVKQSINGMQDIQGYKHSIDVSFNLHHLCHYHNMERFGSLGDPTGMPAQTRPSKRESPAID